MLNYGKHPLSDIEFKSLVETLKFSNELNLDPRDATLYMRNGGEETIMEATK